MSDNLISNADNTIENFSVDNDFQKSLYLPGFTLGDNTSALTSFSALDRGNKNIHNSVFSNLAGDRKLKVKKNHKLTGKKNKIDTYFYNDSPGDPSKCAKECRDLMITYKDGKKKNPCAGFEYDMTTKKCNLYNSISNNYEFDSNFYSGNKVNYNYNINNLDDDNRENVQNRIGSMYLQKKHRVVDTNPKRNLTKCIKTDYANVKLKTIIVFNVADTKWADTYRLAEIWLTYKGKRISDKMNFDGQHFPLGGNFRKTINFNLKENKIDGICFDVRNDGINIDTVDFVLPVHDMEITLFTIKVSDDWIKNRVGCQKFPRVLDLQNLNLSLDGLVNFNGSGSNSAGSKVSYYYNTHSNRQKIDNVDINLKNNNFNITVNYSVQNTYGNNWRNLFRYGSNDSTRVPALWIFPNHEWYMHFRIRTNHSTNDGMDFWIPSQFRKRNTRISLSFEFIEYTYEDNNVPGFLINVTTNGVFTGCWNFYNRNFNRVLKQTMFLKAPEYQPYNYKVYYLKVSSRPLIKMSTGRNRGLYEDANKFNNLVKNLKPPFYFIRVGYSGYQGDYQYIVYKRLTSCENVDMYALFHTDWFDPSRGIKNKFNVDFELYSSIEEAKTGKNRWTFCNFNDPGIGFPRDCGINTGRIKGGQWQSKSRGGNKMWQLYLFKNQGNFLDMSLFDSKVKGYSADAECVYKNLTSVGDIYKSNLKRINKDLSKNTDENDRLINADLGNFINDMIDINDLKNDVSNTSNDPMIERDYLNETKEIKNSNKEISPPSADITGLMKAVGTSSFLENFENNSCNKSSNIYAIIIFLIVCLVIFAIFFR